MESEKPMVIMIAARPGIMRNSMVSYVRTLSTRHATVLVDQLDSALKTLRSKNVKLAIVDADLSEEGMFRLIRLIRAEQPKARLIALVESLRQQQLCLGLGANDALLKGFLDEQLRQAVLSALGDDKSGSARDRQPAGS